MAATRLALQRVLAIRDRGRRLAALRALLPALNATDRKVAAAAIHALEAKKLVTTRARSTPARHVKRVRLLHALDAAVQGKPVQAKPGKAKPAKAKPGKAKPGKAKPGKAKPAQAKPGKAKAAQVKPGKAKPAQAKPGKAKPGKAKPAQAKPVKGKSATTFPTTGQQRFPRVVLDLAIRASPPTHRFDVTDSPIAHSERLPERPIAFDSLMDFGRDVRRGPPRNAPLTRSDADESDSEFVGDELPGDESDADEMGDEVGGTRYGEEAPSREAYSWDESDDDESFWNAVNGDGGVEVEPPVVSLGFSEQATADAPLPRTRTLAAGQPYYLWLEIGTPVSGAINTPTALPLDLLPTIIDLDIVIYANTKAGTEGFIVPKNGGRIQLAHHRSRVTRSVATPVVDPKLLIHRLFFPVTAPAKAGEHRLSCHLYYQGVLVQSHSIVAEITSQPQSRVGYAIAAHMDYVLSEQLTPASLAGYEPHALSIAMGEDDDSSHFFAFHASSGSVIRGAHFDSHEIQDLITRARRAFRHVSWGSDTAWAPGMSYRYDAPTSKAQLTEDLARLAIAGYRIYDVIVDRLGGDANKLAAHMRRPGTIQLALKQSARFVLPLALVYDYQLDTDGDLSSYTLCEQFSQSTAALEKHPCFLGECQQREARRRVVCPSGFWGFRHEIGIPPTLRANEGSPAKLPALIVCPGTPSVSAAVSMDPMMRERDAHLRQIGVILAPSQLRIAETRDEALAMLRQGGAHLLYFYCHGGVADQTPYLQIGAPGERISRATLRTEAVQWGDPRALVFINGCHTTDLEPERAIELVSGFIQTARSSGVIGTEITVFEPLATKFAELCIAALLARQPVGKAIRYARLALLQDWNPLGLLYVPFAMATLRLGPIAA